MNLSPEDVEEILALLDGQPVDDLELETSDLRLTLRRAHDGGGWTQEVETRREPVRVDGDAADAEGTEDVADRAGSVRGPGGGDGPAGDAGAAAAEVPEGLEPVRAPLVGAFYRAPRPGAAPFVEVGDDVDEDTVVGIVETMKLMNSVEAGVRGEVTGILPADAELVQQGQPLVFVRPAS